MPAFKKSIFICEPVRTPIGSFSGALASVTAVQLGIEVTNAVLERTKVPTDSIDEITLGCVLQAGTGQAPARQVAIGAGLSNSVQAMAINKVCSSGLKAVMLAASQIELGIADAIIAGGMESMSQAPYYLPSLRNGARLGHAQAQDSIIFDGLWDPYNNYHMGSAAELCAREYKLSREMQDEYASESYKRALAAIENGSFKEQIVPVTISSRKGDTIVDTDEEPSRFRPEKVGTLQPAFEKDGTVTAVNASSINDGASAMLVCSEDYAKKHGLKPFARLVGQGWNAQEPEWFTTAPIGAAEKVLSDTGVNKADVDLFEVNEAFSAVALACGQGLEVDSAKLNVNGGAVALGHPIGASGARILTTLIHALRDHNARKGLAAICNGGGEATSVLVEAL